MIIKERVFGANQFRDAYSGVNDKWYKKTQKEFNDLKTLIKNIIAQIIMMLMLINIKLNMEYHQEFGKIKVGLILQILMVSSNGILDIGQVEHFQMIKGKQLDKKELQVYLKGNQRK